MRKIRLNQRHASLVTRQRTAAQTIEEPFLIFQFRALDFQIPELG